MREERGGNRGGRYGLFSRIATPIIFVAALAIYLAWEVAHRTLTSYVTSIYLVDPADEWRYTACSRLVRHGYSLFTQVFSAQPPLLFLSLSTGMRVFGETIQDARWVEIGFGLLSLLCVAWIGWVLFGPMAGAAGALLLAISPGFLVYSHTIEAEGPMMALTTLSLALSLVYFTTGRRIFPLLAGFALAASILVKLFALEAFLPALWLIMLGPRVRRENLVAAVTLLGGAVLPLAVEFLLLHPSQQWDQVVALHEKATPHFSQATSSLTILKDFFTLDLGLTLVALIGFLSLLLLGRWQAAILLALWVGGMAVMLILFHPLFPHHPAILITGLAVAAGAGIGTWIPAIESRDRLGFVPLVAVILYAVFLPRLVHDDRHLVTAENSSISQRLGAYVARNTSPGDFVGTDDVEVADVANRLVPPSLCDPSRVRLAAGYLTARDLITATKEYRVKLVVPSFGIYGQVPGYMSWLRVHYRRVMGPGGQEVFSRKL